MSMRTKVGHDVPQLSSADVPIPILIENLERLLNLFLAVGITHLPSHHREELGEVDGAIPVGVDFVDHVL